MPAEKQRNSTQKAVGGLDSALGERAFVTREARDSQAALLESKRFLRSALDALSSHIAILDERGAIIEVNAAWNRFAAENHCLGGCRLGDNYLKVCDSASGNFSKEAPIVASGIRAIIAGRSDEFNLEYPCHGPKEKRWFVVRATRFGGDGPVRVVVAHENITGRKQIEARFRRLADSNVQGVIFANMKGEIIWANDAFLQIVGYTRNDLEAGRLKWTALSPPEYADADRRAVAETVATGTFTPYEKEYLRKDGARVPILIGGAAFEDDSGEGVCFVIDLTRRKRAEASLNLFRTLIDQSSDGFEVIDPKTGRFLDINETTCRQSGYTREELLSMSVPDIETVAVGFSSWRKIVEEIRQAGFGIVEGRHKRKTGSTFPVEVIARYVKLDRDYLIAAVRDISERKHAEAALKNSQSQLRALSARLQSVREEESERMAREIHDELGQALTSLNMDLIWIQQKLQKEKSPLLRPQFQRRIKAAAALLETTVRSVQRISTELRPAMLDDLGLTATLEWQAEEFAKRTGIRCRWHPKPAVTQLNRDHATALFRIFQEILTNVARHARARSVKLKLVRNRGELILKVADDGKGFDEKKLLPHKSLGLLGMRERAAFIGGQVKVCSAPGKGTKIIVTSTVAETSGRRKLKAGGSHGKKNKNSHRR
jgi:PAS domain S-box-containing protein